MKMVFAASLIAFDVVRLLFEASRGVRLREARSERLKSKDLGFTGLFP